MNSDGRFCNYSCYAPRGMKPLSKTKEEEVVKDVQKRFAESLKHNFGGEEWRGNLKQFRKKFKETFEKPLGEFFQEMRQEAFQIERRIGYVDECLGKGTFDKISINLFILIGLPFSFHRDTSLFINSISSILPLRYKSTLCSFELLKKS